MENNTFIYTYSAVKNSKVESIRRKYMPHEESKFERLKKLDMRVQTAGTVESLSLGTVGALVFALGMCFFLDVFTGEAWLTAFLMVLGTAIMIPAYPIYKKIASKTKAKLTPEIIRLADELMK